MIKGSEEKTSEMQTQTNENSPAVLLITANVGSLFEDPTRLLKPWLKEFLAKVTQLQPQFLALHLQEVGGKTYEKSMEYVQEFIRALCEASEMEDFSFIRIYMDEDFNSAEHFTALGNLYFASKNLKDVKIWNFLTHEWELAEDKNIYSGNIETIATKEKSKFPQHFFPECKWSRKGFMRTRWEINHTIIDLVNIHLFHDASNLAACEEFPSVYCKTRRRALVHTLERFHSDKNGLAPYFIFGDFNFRCDTEGVIKELTENLTAHRVQSIKSESTKVHYRNSVGNNVLTVGKKEFNHADHQLKFKESWLKKYDKELEALNEILVEYTIEFPPSYPYEEDPEMPTDYMSTRCPSWCDRILMSPQAKEIIIDANIKNPYSIIGENVCMGDHKPIYLYIRLKPNQGTYRCCKCYLNNSNNNKSTSHHNPAVAISNSSSSSINLHCPYKSQIYNEILVDCKNLNKENICSNINKNKKLILSQNVPGTTIAKDHDLEIPHVYESSQIDEQNVDGDRMMKYPSVSINIIDSDNIHVCMCSQMMKTDEDDIDGGGSGSICPECRHIIQKQPTEHRFRLVSKRLMLANNIYVNRIDTQHLNTCFDGAHQRQDPYTPESAESHSPYPELNSTTTTTTSSNSRSPHEKTALTELDTSTDRDIKSPLENISQLLTAKDEPLEKKNRGIVTPGQLKSRLEDLQRSSMHNLGQQNGGAAGYSDVEDVDEICQTTAAQKRHNNSCLPECCNIH